MRYFYEDARCPWRPDSILRRFLRNLTRRDRAARGRALDIGMGYGRNALWLAEQGYEVEGWELNARYVAEARREAHRRGVKLLARANDFTRARLAGPYEVIVISGALHQVKRSAALRVLRQARTALAPPSSGRVPGGQLFLLVKLTRDAKFQRARRAPGWKPMPGERNTFLRPRERPRGSFHPGRPRRPLWVLSALTPAEVKGALRGLRIRHYRERVLRSDWEEAEPVTHTVAEIVAQRP
ncbi:MAG: class I SAM-dependent methyltransferase [Candidatus Acidiferrales bacterium]